MSIWEKQTENLINPRIKKKMVTFMIAILLSVSCFITLSVKAEAASGTVYACTINRCYRHPVSGVIEDSGGEAAYTTGQGMVEGCIANKGMLEVTDDGHYYLTIQMGLVDYTTDQAFQVQSWGSSSWSDPPLGVTGQGSDSNGTTYDITMEVPGEQCVVRGSMYVQPMGRSVIYYVYPSDFVQSDISGANGMTATMVTEDSSASSDGTTEAAKQNSSADPQTVPDTEASSENTEESTAASETETTAGTQEPETTASSDTGSAGVDTRAGLNLSTEPEDGAVGAETRQDTISAVRSYSMAEQIFINVVSGVIVGLVLLAAAACIIYYFRRNWKRWGGEDEDDYSHLYGEKSGENIMAADDSDWYEDDWDKNDWDVDPYISEEPDEEEKPFADEEVSE